MIPIQNDFMFTRINGFAYGFIKFPPPGIESIIAGYLEMLFRDMLDQKLYKIQHGKRFFHIRVIFMLVIMKSHVFAIIGINSGRGDRGTSKISADIFYHSIRITKVWFCIDIKSFFILMVDGSFHFFKRRADLLLHFI